MPLPPDAKKDFRNFLAMAWEFKGLPEPTPMQYAMAHDMQFNPSKKIMEQGFRQVAKSTIASAFVPWWLDGDPEAACMILSAAKRRADQFASFVLGFINGMPELEHIRPDKRKGHRFSTCEFDVTSSRIDHAPSVGSYSITGQVTGGRASLIILDDIEIPKNASTAQEREKLSERTREIGVILRVNESNTRVIILGTPQTWETVYRDFHETRGYERTIWPCRYPSAEWMGHHGHDLAPFIKDNMDELGPACRTGGGLSGKLGQPTDTRFSEEDLKEIELELGPSQFNLQMMLDTTLSDLEKFPLKLKDLMVSPVNAEKGPEILVYASGPEQLLKDMPAPGFNGDFFHRPMALPGEWVPYSGRAMFIDPSGRGVDETSWCILFALNGNLFCPEWTGRMGGYGPEVLEELAERAAFWKVNHILVEPNMGAGMFGKLLEPVLRRDGPEVAGKARRLAYPVRVEDGEWSQTQKEVRIIETLEPVMASHRLVFDASVIQGDRRPHPGDKTENTLLRAGFYQMTHLSRDRGSLKFDDRIDVLAQGVKYWTDSMALDANKQAQMRAERAYEEWDRHHVSTQAFPGPVKEPNWLDY